MGKWTRRQSAVVAAAALCSLAGSASATIYSLVPSNQPDRDWQSSSQWALLSGAGNPSGFPDATGDVALLGETVTESLLRLGGAIHLGQLDLVSNSAGHHVGVGTLEMDATSGIAQINASGAAAHMLSAEVRLVDSTRISTATAGNLSLSNVNTQGQTLIFDGGGVNSVNGRISGNGTVRKDGAGTLVLGASNTFLSMLEINDGLVELRHASALPSPVTLNGGALSAKLNSTATFNEQLHINGNGVRLISDRAAAGNGLTYGLGDMTIDTPLLIAEAGANVTGGNAGLRGGHVIFEQDTVIDVRRGSAAEMSFSLRVLRGAHVLTKRGAGRMTLTSFAHPTFDQGIRLEEGTLRAQSQSPFGNGLLRMLGGTLELATVIDTPLEARMSVEVPSTIVIDRVSGPGDVAYSTDEIRLGSDLTIGIGQNYLVGSPRLNAGLLPVLVPAILTIPERARLDAKSIRLSATLTKDGQGELIVSGEADAAGTAGLVHRGGTTRLTSSSAVRGPLRILGGQVHLSAENSIQAASVELHGGKIVVDHASGLMNGVVQLNGGILELANRQGARHEAVISVAGNSQIHIRTAPEDLAPAFYSLQRVDVANATLAVTGDAVASASLVTTDMTSLQNAAVDVAENIALALGSTTYGGQVRKAGRGTLRLAGAAQGGGSLHVESGATSVEYDGIALPRSVTISGGEVQVRAANQIDPSTQLSAHGTGKLALGGESVFQLGSLTVSEAARVDLEEAGMVLTGGDLIALKAALVAGRNAPTGGGPVGRWNGGSGIVSSSLAQLVVERGREEMSLGYLFNAESPLGRIETFLGEAVGPTDILLRRTRTGDADLDGRVNGRDITILAGFYRSQWNASSPVRHWYQGDFNFDGRVDNNDITILAGFYAPNLAPAEVAAPAAVPEPSLACVSLILAAQPLLRRRLPGRAKS